MRKTPLDFDSNTEIKVNRWKDLSVDHLNNQRLLLNNRMMACQSCNKVQMVKSIQQAINDLNIIIQYKMTKNENKRR